MKSLKYIGKLHFIKKKKKLKNIILSKANNF